MLTSIDVRFHVRKLIEQECFDTPVLSYHELMPTLKLDVDHPDRQPGGRRFGAAGGLKSRAAGGRSAARPPCPRASSRSRFPFPPRSLPASLSPGLFPALFSR